MKRICLYASAMILATCFSQMALAADATYNVVKTKTPITIDGTIDAQWDKAVTVVMSPDDAVVQSVGKVWGPAVAKGTFKVMWDAKNTYWAFDIKDDNLFVDKEDNEFWARDAVAGYLYNEEKEVNLKFFTTPKDAPYTCWGVISGGIEASPDIKTGYKITKTGYTVEVAVPWALLNDGVAKVGDIYKFTTLVVDAGGEWSQYMWVGDGDDTSRYADAKFVD